MIEVYSWPAPNGHKVHIMLEECGLKYRVHPVDLGAGDQFALDFLAISPNNKIPAITDADGPGGEPISLFESGAILLHLAGRTGNLDAGHAATGGVKQQRFASRGSKKKPRSIRTGVQTVFRCHG